MILYQIWCKRTYVSGGFCEGEDEPTQLIFTTLDKERSKIPKDHYSKENGQGVQFCVPVFSIKNNVITI